MRHSAKLGLFLLTIQLWSLQAWGSELPVWHEVEGLPDVQLGVYTDASGAELARLRVGEREWTLQSVTLPAGLKLYHWGKQDVVADWISAGRISAQTLDSLTSKAGYAVRGLYVSMHPWDSVNYGPHLLEIELTQPVAVLVSTAAAVVQGQGLLPEIMDHMPASDPAQWRALLQKAGFAGVYLGTVASESTDAGIRWLALMDAVALERVHLVTAAELLENLALAPWSWMEHGSLPVALLQLLAVARAEEYGCSEEQIRAMLDPNVFGWMTDAIHSAAALDPQTRAALWQAAPAMDSSGGEPLDTALFVCSMVQDETLIRLNAAPLCRRFVEQMCPSF